MAIVNYIIAMLLIIVVLSIVAYVLLKFGEFIIAKNFGKKK